MSYSVKGTLKRVGNIEIVGSNNFMKRTFVVETKENYPQTLEFQLTKDRVDIIEVYATGEEMEVHFNLRGREWTNPQSEIKVFNTLECWKLVKVAGQPQASSQPAEMDMRNDMDIQQSKPAYMDNYDAVINPQSDLPF